MNHEEVPVSTSAANPVGSSMTERRGALSCAECRRSKLKCDRTIPCSTCVRRGCSELCPDKSLTATKGNKALMVHAQRLELEVKTMRSKIKQLEKALANAHPKTNALADMSFLNSKSPQDCAPNLPMHPNDEANEVATSIGSFSIGSDGQTKYHGSFAGSECLSRFVLSEEEDESQLPQTISARYLGSCPELVELVMASPYGIRGCKYQKTLFMSFMPSRQVVRHLANLYYQNAAWMYDPVIRDEFDSTIVNAIYDGEGVPNLDAIHPHRLSVFFITLATGAIFDEDVPLMAGKYNALAAAALSLESILRNVTLSALQALFLMVRFSYITEPTIDETRWLLFGACARAAQVIGLQRDSEPWNLDAQEIQKRRLVFWEIYTWDSWASFLNARPCMFRLEEIDCCFPEDYGFVRPNGEVELSYQGWKFRYQVACVSQTMRYCMAHKTPNYSTFLELDRRIRTFPLPTHLISPMDESGQGWSPDPSHAMQQYSVVVNRESNLLFLHRSYFAKAIRELPRNPLGHKYSPSVLAAYRSARRLISSLRGLYAAHPRLTSATRYFWAAIYSACYILGGIVAESPSCSLAQPALTELERTVPFFSQGSLKCRIPGTMLLLEKLLLQAQTIFTGFQNGLETSSVYLAEDSDLLDEAAIIGGRARVFKTAKPASVSPKSQKISSYSNNSVNLNDFFPDVNMDFFSPQQFMTRDPISVAAFGPSPHTMLNQMFPRFSQSMMNYTPSDLPLYQQQPPSGSNPNEVWFDFLQQLNMDGYNDISCS